MGWTGGDSGNKVFALFQLPPGPDSLFFLALARFIKVMVKLAISDSVLFVRGLGTFEINCNVCENELVFVSLNIQYHMPPHLKDETMVSQSAWVFDTT